MDEVYERLTVEECLRIHNPLFDDDVDFFRDWVAQGHSPNAVWTEVSRGGAPPEEPIIQPLVNVAIDAQSLGVVRTLCESGCDRAGLLPFAIVFVQKFTGGPGMIRSRSKALRCVQLLLEFNPDPEEKQTALHQALFSTVPSGRSELVDLLLRFGTDPRSMMTYSISQNKAEALSVLLKHGVDPNFPSDNGLFPLYMAALLDSGVDRSDVVRVLLRQGASIDHPRLTRGELLEIARARAHEHVAKLLSDVASAGSWKRFVLEPRIKLLLLRKLCQRGRARPPRCGILSRLFSESALTAGAKRRAAASPLPEGIFWQVASYWRSGIEVGES